MCVCVAVGEDGALKPRNILLFINPMAGTQKGHSTFKQHVKPLFDLAEINYVVKVTGNQAYLSIYTHVCVITEVVLAAVRLIAISFGFSSWSYLDCS